MQSGKGSMAEDVLEDLTRFIRGTMPTPKELSAMEINREANVAVFHWQSRDFVCTPTLVVSERKGINLFKTASSTLIQGVLAGKRQTQQVAASAVESLQKAEDFARVKDLDAVKRVLDGVRALLKRQIIPLAVSRQ